VEAARRLLDCCSVSVRVRWFAVVLDPALFFLLLLFWFVIPGRNLLVEGWRPLDQLGVQVFPDRVDAVDEFDLLGAGPSLELLESQKLEACSDGSVIISFNIAVYGN
jgi:hypothetical protein